MMSFKHEETTVEYLKLYIVYMSYGIFTNYYTDEGDMLLLGKKKTELNL